jgi:hypothetical protein
VDYIMERLRNLEGLVKELRGQLEHAHASAAGGSAGGGPTQDRDAELHFDAPHTAPLVDTARDMRKHFGRLVLQDTSQSRYVSSGFWSRVNDEVVKPAFIVSFLPAPFAPS